MMLKVNSEFLSICNSILVKNLTVEEWCKIESCDEFQTTHFCGGFDATEREFCFSYFNDHKEYWFQLSLDDIKKIIDQHISEITISLAK